MERTWDRFFDENGKLLFEEMPPVYKKTRTFYRVSVDCARGLAVYEERHENPKAQGYEACED